MARTELDALRARLRVMCDDTVPASYAFTDLELDDVLERYAFEVEGEFLKPRRPVGTTGPRWHESIYSQFESLVEVYEGSLTAVTPTAYDYDRGRFELPWPNVYRLWGTCYDLHGAAADLWAIRAGNRSLWKGQTGLLMQEVIKRHLSLSWGRNGNVTRV
jgi:hypothetical protein